MDDVMNQPQPTNTWTCDCGEPMARYPREGDQSCTNCGQWFNASGQRLRNDWMNNASLYDDDIDDLTGYEIAAATAENATLKDECTDQPQFLVSVQNDSGTTITWDKPSDLDRLAAAQPDDLTIIVIDAAVWAADGCWDDTDPFERLSTRFDLDRTAECMYVPTNPAAFGTTIAQLLSDPRFRYDDSI